MTQKRPYVRRAKTKPCPVCGLNPILSGKMCKACYADKKNRPGYGLSTRKGRPSKEPPLHGFVRLADIPVPRWDPWNQSPDYSPTVSEE